MPFHIQNPIFSGITDTEFKEMQDLGCIRTKTYPKNTPVFYTGDLTKELGLVLSGRVTIENIDLWGNRNILSDIAPGHAFAETYALANLPLMVDAITSEESQILLVNVKDLLTDRYAQTSWQPKLIRNLLLLTTRKNLTLSSRIFCTAPKKIRPRVLIYLSNCSVQYGSPEFDIPFDRQELADYLNLDRTALSKELAKMKADGLIDYQKNHFVLYATNLF
jgi:CRP/FNR family transcriptional regulator, dissimilatory nitrate respiration regulator